MKTFDELKNNWKFWVITAITFLAVFFVLFGLSVLPIKAAWIYNQNFETLPLGFLAGQDGWQLFDLYSNPDAVNSVVEDSTLQGLKNVKIERPENCEYPYCGDGTGYYGVYRIFETLTSGSLTYIISPYSGGEHAVQMYTNTSALIQDYYSFRSFSSFGNTIFTASSQLYPEGLSGGNTSCLLPNNAVRVQWEWDNSTVRIRCFSETGIAQNWTDWVSFQYVYNASNNINTVVFLKNRNGYFNFDLVQFGVPPLDYSWINIEAPTLNQIIQNPVLIWFYFFKDGRPYSQLEATITSPYKETSADYPLEWFWEGNPSIIYLNHPATSTLINLELKMYGYDNGQWIEKIATTTAYLTDDIMPISTPPPMFSTTTFIIDEDYIFENYASNVPAIFGTTTPFGFYQTITTGFLNFTYPFSNFLVNTRNYFLGVSLSSFGSTTAYILGTSQTINQFFDFPIIQIFTIYILFIFSFFIFKFIFKLFRG